MTKIGQLALAVLASGGIASIAAAGEAQTALSRNAANIQLGQSRTQVLSALGLPTWAVIKADKGGFSIDNPRIAFSLYWRNGPCSPVVVDFDARGSVNGMDEGRGSCGGLKFEPGESRACSLPDRANVCK